MKRGRLAHSMLLRLSRMQEHSQNFEERRITAPPVRLMRCRPVDNAQLVKRQGRFGEFISCRIIPSAIHQQETIGVNAATGCGGEIVVKKFTPRKSLLWLRDIIRSATGFWTSRSWKKCPQCGKPFLLEKTTKKGTTRRCADESADTRATAAATCD